MASGTENEARAYGKEVRFSIISSNGIYLIHNKMYFLLLASMFPSAVQANKLYRKTLIKSVDQTIVEIVFIPKLYLVGKLL